MLQLLIIVIIIHDLLLKIKHFIFSVYGFEGLRFKVSI